ncbi:amidase [Variovorax sp.]|jgi:amidase|uniref:amidase n=1 Tax=Variovorax sp. TaxID=1871043 RepID=UPI00120E0763|nr:amidase [Variovorax sp.]TAJ58309.1 MAG: amidase [Variovorax sp.]
MSDAVLVPELCRLPARELAALIRRRALSSREVVSAFLQQVDALNPRFNAIVSRVEREQVLAEADAADAAVARGDALGALHGLPQAIKDTAPVRGLRSTFGSPLFADHLPAADAIMVERMRAAGAIFIGKTNVPEFGLGSHTYNPVFGATGNAWDPRFSAGGSSGGTAVALALRMLPVADGADMGGSLRNPAAFNNVLGLRPSQGRVPFWPRGDAFAGQLTTEGPMGRSADDLALLLSVQSGYDARAPLSLDGAVPDWHDRLERDFAGARIGWLGDLGGHLPFEPGILALCEAALARFGDAGLQVEPARTDFDWERVWHAFTVLRQFIIGGKHGAHYDAPASRALQKPELQWEIEQYRKLSADDLYRAALDRTAWYDCLLGLFERHDFLALPTAQVFPFAIEAHWPREIAGRAMSSYHRWMEVVTPGTLSGCPVISLPVGFDARGLPMGMQIIGRPRDDLSVLQLTHLYESLSPFLRMAPPALRMD